MSRSGGPRPGPARGGRAGAAQRGAADEAVRRMQAFRDALETLARYAPGHLRDEPKLFERALMIQVDRLWPVGIGEVQGAYARLCGEHWQRPEMAGEFATDEVHRALHTVAELWETYFAGKTAVRQAAMD